MKKIFISFLVILLAGFIACSNDSGKDSDNSTSKKRVIKGTAVYSGTTLGKSATINKSLLLKEGASFSYVSTGAKVEVRPASVDGINPADIIKGTVGENGEFVIEIPEEIPVVSDGEEVVEKSSIQKSSAVFEQGAGFIVRVKLEDGPYLYSYSENNGEETIANINPYTDKMIRQFYKTANNTALSSEGFPSIYENFESDYYNTNIDYIFNEGVFKKLDIGGGTVITIPINIPNSITLSTVMTVMDEILKLSYGIESLQNALQDNWNSTTSWNTLLGISELNAFLEYEFTNLFEDPNGIIKGAAVHNGSDSPVIVEIWTIQDDAPEMIFNGISIEMKREVGVGHFSGTTGPIQQIEYNTRNVAFEFSDGSSCNLAIVCKQRI